MNIKLIIIVSTFSLVIFYGNRPKSQSVAESKCLLDTAITSSKCGTAKLMPFVDYPDSLAHCCTGTFYLSEEDEKASKLIAFAGCSTKGFVALVSINRKLTTFLEVDTLATDYAGKIKEKFYYTHSDYDLEIEVYAFKHIADEIVRKTGLIRLLDKKRRVLCEIRYIGVVVC